MLLLLAQYVVDVRSGACHHTLTAAGEDELATLARILGRSGFDFDVRLEPSIADQARERKEAKAK